MSDAGADGTLPYSGPMHVTIGGDAAGNAIVDLDLDRFAFRVKNPAGAVLFDSPADVSPIHGDDVGAYGSLGATHHETYFHSTIIEGWDHVTGQDDAWSHAVTVTAASFDAMHAAIDLTDPTASDLHYHVELVVDGREVHIDASVSAPSRASGDHSINQMGLTFRVDPRDHFFGLGERYVTVDHLGQHFECWVEEGGIGQGEAVTPGPTDPSPNGLGMTHLPIPFTLSPRGWGLFQNTTFRTGFALASDDPAWARIYAETPELHLRIYTEDTPRDLLSHFTLDTGRAHAPAPWVFGPRRRVDHGTQVSGVPEYQALRQQHVPTTMIDDTNHFLPSNSGKGEEGALSDWNATMHGLGFKSIAYFNAYVSTTDTRAADLVAQGRAHNYFVLQDDGTEFDTFMVSGGGQTVATIDMTNPAAVDWYHTLLQQALDLGYDGWMLDFGEYLPQNALMFNGRTGWEEHNQFPVDYQHATYDWLRTVKGDDFMFFARAGYIGTQAIVPVVWSGDPAASFDEAKGMPANLRAGINAGLSGIPFWGSDISGYTCANDPPPDKEVYLRWAELGALSSDMHDENACSAAPTGSPPKWTLWNDAETTTVYGNYARLHTRLNPYLYSMALEAESTGLPIMRHPIFEAPTEPLAQASTEEYFFGDALYVAPVVHRGDVTRALYLPPGIFVDWWTLAARDGGAHGVSLTVDAPLDTLPLFQRAGTLVPMLDASIETLMLESNPDVVGPTDVTGVLDVRGVVASGQDHARITLGDGTVLYVSWNDTTPILPSGMTPASESDLATCGGCGRLDDLGGGVLRVRVTTVSATEATVSAGGLLLRHQSAPAALRVRWDVAVVTAATTP
ncbi:MAG: TIM-barrel domain-containing protein [Polyangiales bacterium]